MANDIDEIFYDVDADVGRLREPRLYENPRRLVTLAHPFSDDDLRGFQASGEHPGFD